MTVKSQLLLVCTSCATVPGELTAPPNGYQWNSVIISGNSRLERVEPIGKGRSNQIILFPTGCLRLCSELVQSNNICFSVL